MKPEPACEINPEQTAAALRESEAMLRAFFDNPGLLCGIVEVVQDDLLHITDNAGAAQFFGRTVAEMRQKRASELGVPPAIIRLWIGHYGESERTGRPVNFEYHHAQGTTSRHFRVTVSHLSQGRSGSRFAYVVEDISERKRAEAELRLDVTARKQAEEAVRASQELIEGIMNTMPVRVFWKDKNLNFLGCNPAFARDAGFADPQDVIGKNSYQTAGRDRAELYHNDDRQVIESGNSKLLIEEQQTTRDGRTRTLLTSKLPLRNAQGEINGVLGTYMDISDRKQAEEQLRDRNRQLGEALNELNRTQRQVIQQEQLRGLGQMASGVAHDFNNALAPIIGFSEFLLQHPEKLADQVQVLKWLTSIHTCATDAAAVVRRMREFGRQEQGRDKLVPVDLNQVVLQTLELTEPRWKDQAQATGRTIHIATDLQPVPLIAGEEYAIRELLTNLIFNAVDALTNGGTLTLGTVTAGEYLNVWVRDTGIGMTAETRQRCFEPFFTTKGPQGSGLGLSLVHGIVQRHGGTLEIESQLGQGTTVTVRFPITRTQPGLPVPPVAAPRTRPLRVLVVDDEPVVCEVVQEWLTIDGHTVATVTNGTAALQQLKTERFDLVITDKSMPDMSGDQLAIAIHEGGFGLPVILMTGFGDLMKEAGEMPPHVRAILSKPMTGATFRAVLAEVFPTASADQG